MLEHHRDENSRWKTNVAKNNETATTWHHMSFIQSSSSQRTYGRDNTHFWLNEIIPSGSDLSPFMISKEMFHEGVSSGMSSSNLPVVA